MPVDEGRGDDRDEGNKVEGQAPALHAQDAGERPDVRASKPAKHATHGRNKEEGAECAAARLSGVVVCAEPR